MKTIDKKTFTFLRSIKKNNNRDWFGENKSKFEEVKAEFKKFMEYTLSEMQKHDDIENMKIYRIYRDIRFSKDKTPYKNSLSGHFTRASKWKRGGYYFHLEPGNKSFVGGGFWQPNKEDLFRIRKEIETNDKAFRKVFTSASFKKTFGILEGEQLKTAPKGFDKEHKAIDLLRYKSYVCSAKLSDKELMEGNAAKLVSMSFKKLRPFFDLFSEVLTTNLNGEKL